jgi:hypothetical protein
MYERGLCSWGQPQATTTATTPPAVGAAVQTAPTDPLTALTVVLGSLLGLVTFVVGGVVLSYVLKPDPALPLPGQKPRLLPPPPQGNEGHGIPTVEAPEFDWNSHEFAGNSQGGGDGIPQDTGDWPPKGMGPAYDPQQPEQPGEFDSYRRTIEADGLSPKGNDIIKALWGATPGRSAAYQAARDRRDAFAKRLNYYRYEEL